MANIVRRSAHRLGGEEITVKLISRNNPNGRGKFYDVTVNDSMEYQNIKDRSDAKQLYRQAKKDAKQQLKNGGGAGGGLPGMGGGGGLPGMGSGGGGQPSFPGMMGAADDDGDDDDEDSGPYIPGL